MIAYLTVVRYPKYCYWAGITTQHLFNFVLSRQKQIHYYKIYECGYNGVAESTNDARSWAIMVVVDFDDYQKKVIASHSNDLSENLSVGKNGQLNFVSKVWKLIADNLLDAFEIKEATNKYYPKANVKKIAKLFIPKFMVNWWQFFKCTISTIIMEPIAITGNWDEITCFGAPVEDTSYKGDVAELEIIKKNKKKKINKQCLNNHFKNTYTKNKHKIMEGLLASMYIKPLDAESHFKFSIWENATKIKNKIEHSLKQTAHKVEAMHHLNAVRFKILETIA